MATNMPREEMLQLTSRLLNGEGTDEEASLWINTLSREIPNPHFGQLIMDAHEDQTAEDILSLAEQYRPVEL